VSHSRHPLSIILSSLGVMPRVSTTLHLLLHIDDITRLIAIYNDTYRFFCTPILYFVGIYS